MKKFALVVGASGAIGEAIANSLAKDGWSLYLHYAHNAKKMSELTKALTETYQEQEFMAVQADFNINEGAEQLAAQIFSLQAIVFAQGQSLYTLLEDTTLAHMESLWRVHVQNPMRTLALLSSKLRQHERSYVLFIGSIWGEVGAAGEVAYSAVKGAQHSFVKAYAQEVAYNGIRVNAIAPGFIDTNMNQHLSVEERADVINNIPLQQLGQTEDVANMVAFYMSGKADYATGQIIRLNGGWYI